MGILDIEPYNWKIPIPKYQISNIQYPFLVILQNTYRSRLYFWLQSFRDAHK